MLFLENILKYKVGLPPLLRSPEGSGGSEDSRVAVFVPSGVPTYLSH